MKLMFASDIHGSATGCEAMLSRFEAEKPDKLILLGDLLYHGPRNDLPERYDPKAVIAMLNAAKQHLLCVRGNCDAEVDQMVLDFPVMADYMTMWTDSRMIFCTHGHLYDKRPHPPVQSRAKERHLLHHYRLSLPAKGRKSPYLRHLQGQSI